MKEVQTSVGIFKLRRPIAKERNAALMEAETPDGIKKTVMFIKLLPMMVVEHPFGPKPTVQVLDEMDPDDYDLLIEAAGELVQPKSAGDAEKKSG